MTVTVTSAAAAEDRRPGRLGTGKSGRPSLPLVTLDIEIPLNPRKKFPLDVSQLLYRQASDFGPCSIGKSLVLEELGRDHDRREEDAAGAEERVERVAAASDELGGGDSELVGLFCQEGLSLADGRATAQAV
jgi:hypothetical protein